MKKLILTMALALLLSIATALAQSIQPIYSFPQGPLVPFASLVQGADGNFYRNSQPPVQEGITALALSFEVSTNGTLRTLTSFANTNGAYPYAGLTLGPDGAYYGTTRSGGLGASISQGFSPSGYGTVFRVTTNGVLTTMVAFAQTNGAYSWAGLTLGQDGNFYGATRGGGDFYSGTVFKMSTNGVLTMLASFNGTNGETPQASLTTGPDGNMSILRRLMAAAITLEQYFAFQPTAP